MDSHHRHELQQNDLGKLTNQAVPVLERYRREILVATVTVAGVCVVGVIWLSQSATVTADSWTQFDKVLHQQNSSAGDFANIAEKHPGSAVAGWALLKEAEDYLKSGLQTVYTNRDVSQGDLKKAKESLQKLVAGGPGIVPEIQERAYFDLARCLEAMSDGTNDDALDTYKQLVRKFPESIFLNLANQRIKELETPEAKEFYAWFHQQKPKPSDPHLNPFRKPPAKFGEESGTMPDEDEEAAMDEPADAAPDTPATSTEEKPDGDAKPDTKSKSKDEPAAEKSDKPESK